MRVREVRALRERAFALRWDVLPFALLYSALAAVTLMHLLSPVYTALMVSSAIDPAESEIESDELTETDPALAMYTTTWIACGLPAHLQPPLEFLLTLGSICSLLLHALVLLFCRWSVSVHSKVRYSACALDSATMMLVLPHANRGKPALCPLSTSTWTPATATASSASLNRLGCSFFEYQSRKYFLQAEDGGRQTGSALSFSKAQLPLGRTYGEYLASPGLTAEEVTRQQMIWGRNRAEIPMPSFRDLYLEHALAPFFVFQVFCVGLWLLDDYWYYALFTLVMLFFFEMTVVRSRLRTVAKLRGMIKGACRVDVYRNGHWISVESTELVPGDVCNVRTGSNNESGLILPCDLLLLTGSCVVNESMLTGESVPQLKEGVSDRDAHLSMLPLREDRVSVLYSGTRLIQNTRDPVGEQKLTGVRGGARHDGCLAYVLRTGFETSQGKLIRTIVYSTEHVTANSVESFLFICVLLVFAIAASGYVLIKGLEDEERSRYSLLIECTLILTSVVPPELPMELSLAVNTSLLRLARLGVFCTEPFRIPFAGKLDVCCFDKTGTLTSDEIVLCGLADPSQQCTDGDFVASQDIRVESEYIMAACHSLISMNFQPVGDAMEKEALFASGWSLSREGNTLTKKHASARLQILRRFHFASALKRMSVLIHEEMVNGGGTRARVLVKGAPEVIVQHLSEIPDGYEECYKHHSRAGKRVLALAQRVLKGASLSKLHNLTRDEAESELEFAGFLVFECPIKPESPDTIAQLRNSSHRVAMITGDNVLTAVHVASQLRMCTKPVLLLSMLSDNPADHQLCGVSVDGETQLEFGIVAEVAAALQQYDYALSGPEMSRVELRAPRFARALFPLVKVFARVSPLQKESIIATLRDAGYCTLMCGDGTNDVGALRRAEVGVALLTASPVANSSPSSDDPRSTTSTTSSIPTSTIKTKKTKTLSTTSSANSRQRQSNARRRPDRSSKSRTDTSRSTPASRAPPSTAQTSLDHNVPFSKFRTKMDRLYDELDSDGMVQLGDASIASPFTAKSSSPAPVLDVIRQGRCTLVTTLQMFKILALNCLITAFSLSVLYLNGVKMGDTQATAAGILIAACFLFISRSEPAKTLSRERPPSRVFTLENWLSILGQFAIHLGSLWHVYSSAVTASADHDPEAVDLEADFEPSLINSSVFLISTCMQVSTFVVNYHGAPFMQSLLENRGLLFGLLAAAGITFVAASEISPAFNEMLEIVPFPPEFRVTLLTTMAIDFGGAWIYKLVIKFLFWILHGIRRKVLPNALEYY